MKEIASVLSKFGFSEPEVAVYVTVLTLGKASITEIARKMDKSREIVYFHANNLVKKKVLHETRKGTVKHYVAESPEDLSARFENWVVDYKSLLPTLGSLASLDKEAPIIKVTESTQGFQEIYDEISSLPEKSVFRIIEGTKAVLSELAIQRQNDWSKFFRRMQERKIETRALFTQEAVSAIQKKLSQESYNELLQRVWNIKTLGETDFPFYNLLFIWGNKISFLVADEQVIVTLQHREIVAMMRTLFDCFFAGARPEQFSWATTN